MSVDPSIAAQFIVNACPDHHVRDGPSHVVVRQVAHSILRLHPEIAASSLPAAIVCGNLVEVERILRERPSAATESAGPKGSAEAQGTHLVVEPETPDPPLWQPLHYLCFTRVDHAPSNANAVAIARLLLEHGADPTAHFMAGGSRYTPLVGVVGAGEEGRAPHPERDALTRLLLEHGADPFDVQVHYDVRFTPDARWYLQLAYDWSLRHGRRDAWDDPEWAMIDMGGYGRGARWFLDSAVEHNNLDLAAWMLTHGATANPAAAPGNPVPSETLVDIAERHGFIEMATLLVRHGGRRGRTHADDEIDFMAACMRLDREAAVRMLERHPEHLTSHRAMHSAVTQDRTDVVALLVDLGRSIEVENEHKQRPLHVAAWNRAYHAAADLLRRGAAPDARETHWGNTPLDFAVHVYDQRMIAVLAECSRDIWNLVFTGQVERVRDVLRTEPAIARTVSGERDTPLMWLPADEDAALEIVEMFIAHGADVTVRNTRGMTAEDWARKRWMFTVANRLLTAS